MASTNPNTPVNEDDLWYHGKITREEAERLLLEDGKEGTFLVRDSSSTAGDYAISVVYEGNVHHFQVCRRGTDAFFSMATEDGVIHGLDELIKHYQSPNSQTLLLGRPLVKSPAPPECRRHGRTNLLHRATKEGNIVIVQELLSCGTRSKDAKNEDGQTAAHLAAIKGHSDILKVLIDSDIYVNCKDSSGQTPLHYACIHNHPETVRVLLNHGKANPQLRRTSDGWVPLHEAAARGHTLCVAHLLDIGAPLRPRTNDGKLPIQLAVEKCQKDTVKFIREYRPRPCATNRDDWYHSLLDRQGAVDLLQSCQVAHNNDSAQCYFLVRRSNRNPGQKQYVLTLLYGGRAQHYEISQEGMYYFIDNGPYLESLEEIIDHYSRWSDGLPAPLQVPACPTQSFGNHTHTVVASPDNLNVTPPPLPRRTPLPSPNGLRLNSLPTLNLQDLEDRINQNTDQQNVNRSSKIFAKDNIPQENIKLMDLIGEGEYGDVYKGQFLDADNNVLFVAVKTLKEELTLSSKNELLREGRIMMKLEHKHIVRFIGISWEPKFWMVQELMEFGSLDVYLRLHKDSIDPSVSLPLWAYQVTSGMMYLEEKEIVHRDLAVRNILLKDENTAKISDFGLSRVLGDGKDYYAAAHGGRWPIKWYAPECCFHGTFTHKSDIWSFGITLWEMYSFGATPYGSGAQGQQVIDMIDKGYRLERPEECPEDVYEKMFQCWKANPADRPTSAELTQFFKGKIRLETFC